MREYLVGKYFQFEKSIKNFRIFLSLFYSRSMAHKYRKQVVRKNGKTVMNKHLKSTMKVYAKERFGNKAYWPYLALYTEIRGEYKKGWIPDDYFTHILEPRINVKKYCNLSEQKTFDYRIFGDFAVKPLFMFISGNFYNTEQEMLEVSHVEGFMKGYDDKIVLKEEFGYGGKQVSIMHSSEFNTKNMNKDINYIIQPYIKQSAVLSKLYPNSVNTLRICTFLKQDGSIDVKFVVLRFGVDGLKVDNLSSGGQFIYFDEAGRPSKYAYDIMGYNLGHKHKNSGYVFLDMEIPNFQEVIEKCKDAHIKYPYVKLVSWDVCIDYSDKPLLVEWNCDTVGFWFFDAVFGPFWPDDEDEDGLFN